MSAAELAKRLGISRSTLFTLKKLYPREAPKTFVDVETWRHFCLRYVLNPESITRLTNAR